MKGRNFSWLILTLIVLLFFLCLAGNVAANQDKQTQKIYRWKVQHFAGAGTMFDEWGKHLAERITEMSDGHLVIDYNSGGSIVSASELPNAVSSGLLDAANSYSALWQGYEYAAPLFCASPGLFSDGRDMIAWLYKGNGLELWQEMLDPYGVKVFPCTITDMEVFQYSNKPIRSIEDMKGLRMRMMPLMGEVLSDHGMSVFFLPGSEVVPSLEKHVIDSAEYTMPAVDIDLGFADAVKFFHYPGIHQPSSIGEFIINADSWAELPDYLKLVVETACSELLWYSWLDQGERNLKAIAEFKEKGVEQVILPDDVLQTMNNWIDEWYAKKVQEEPFLKKVRESQVEFAKEWLPYKESIYIPPPEWAK